MATSSVDATGEFDGSTRRAAADLDPARRPQASSGWSPKRLSGAGCRDAGLTVVSCDNMPGNGNVARRSFTAFAGLRDPELAEWMDDNVAFPNSMVDRITPVTTDSDRGELSERFGIEDAWPVVGEPFSQWVLEDRFANGRPPLEDVGVQFVADVEPYELMKLRLLNASHQVISYLGYLAGYRYVHEVCQDPAVSQPADAIHGPERRPPPCPPVPGIDLR